MTLRGLYALLLSATACGAFSANEPGAPAAADSGAPQPGAPVVVASDVGVQGLLASRDRLAWLASDKLWVRRGSEAAYLAAEAEELPVPGHMTIDGDDLYFSSGSLITHCAITGALCPKDSPIPGLNDIGPLAVRDRTLMLTNSPGPGPVLYACPLPGCGSGPTLIAPLGGAPTRMVATIGATMVSLLEGTSSNTSIVKYVGSAATTLASDVKALTGLATDGTTLYWTDAGDGAVRSCPVQGGPIRDLATGRAGPLEVAVDGTRLYWLEANAGKVIACELPDCAAPASIADVKKPSHLAVGDRVYYASDEDRAIYAVAK